ncbi:M23 family metallopeptidase [Consotaella salsifontis]|uniref:Murein DD-endopeptidase MepM and murein hydrolase activator NlpD, contain LysM domain n=1 Tax=Consotaella salsifontis TaxID=1365950 RepID=A0A1T4LQT5_9HYPH|nr:M23 family metallopeptidase [Consotaella salsifontis]SJZ57090.1 Murein DD-endopeptidase MepM and murein hydrolase activator NlpD, contain LysM domain [Consotaella salsifontis]
MSAALNTTLGLARQPHTVIIRGEGAVRQFTVRPWAAALAGGVAALLVLGTALSTASFLFGSNFTSGSPDQTQITQSYEERIASLREQLDRVTSRQMIDRETLKTKVDTLLDQQNQLSARYERLTPLFRKARAVGLISGGVPIPTPRPVDLEKVAALPAPNDPPLMAYAGNAASDRLSRFSLIDRTQKERPSIAAGDASDGAREGLTTVTGEDFILRIGSSIEDVEREQIDQIRDLAANARRTAEGITSALEAGGIEVPSDQGKPNTGGPFIPAPANAFDNMFGELDSALDELEALKLMTNRIPLRTPVAFTYVSSPFGVRGDPFLGRKAMHEGIDFVAPSGTEVKAAAHGKVVHAGPTSGYGNMIEIDHGDGFSTRYAHLSSISVSVGEDVEAGDSIGAVGSTGRSTGPHLHYEVRDNGRAVNPNRFLAAGRQINSLS